MLETRREERTERSARPGAAFAVAPGATEFLMDILDSAGSYDTPIREAERAGDVELASFLRGLQRQDLARLREATRLLRRPPARAGGEDDAR